jgi:hypothetical protein
MFLGQKQHRDGAVGGWDQHPNFFASFAHAATIAETIPRQLDRKSTARNPDPLRAFQPGSRYWTTGHRRGGGRGL